MSLDRVCSSTQFVPKMSSYSAATVTSITHEVPKDLSYPYACRVCGDLSKGPPLQFGRQPFKTLPIDLGLCFAHWSEWLASVAKARADAADAAGKPAKKWVKPAPSPLRITV